METFFFPAMFRSSCHLQDSSRDLVVINLDAKLDEFCICSGPNLEDVRKNINGHGGNRVL